jgi:hypothetical protein
MKALSVRQPWAWLLVAGIKPIENRTWFINYRGPLLIHAGQAPDNTISIAEIEQTYDVEIDRHALRIGGVVGRVELVDIVTRHESRFFHGPYGWIFTKPLILPFMRCSGRQGTFDVNYTHKEGRQ